MIELPDGRQVKLDRNARRGLVELLNSRPPHGEVVFGRRNFGFCETFKASYDGERLFFAYHQTRRKDMEPMDPSEYVAPAIFAEWELIDGSESKWQWTPRETMTAFSYETGV